MRLLTHWKALRLSREANARLEADVAMRKRFIGEPYGKRRAAALRGLHKKAGV